MGLEEDLMIPSRLCGTSWDGYAEDLPAGVKTVEEQWRAWRRRPFPLEQSGAADFTAFAALHGPALANLRARFLKSSHPGWEVLGKWLWSNVEEAVEVEEAEEWLVLGRNLLEAGIFFDSFDLLEVLLVCARRFEAMLLLIESRVRHEDMYGVSSPLWHLHLQPHLEDIIDGQLQHFPCSCRYSEEDPDCAYGWGLSRLLLWLPLSRRAAYIRQLCLMMPSLGCRLKYTENAAVDAMLYSGDSSPRPYIGRLVDMVNQGLVLYKVPALLTILARTPPGDSPALRNAIKNERGLFLVRTALRLSHMPPAMVLVLLKAQVKMERPALVEMWAGLRRSIQVVMPEEKPGVVRAFTALCRRSLTPEQLEEFMEEVGHLSEEAQQINLEAI